MVGKAWTRSADLRPCSRQVHRVSLVACWVGASPLDITGLISSMKTSHSSYCQKLYIACTSYASNQLSRGQGVSQQCRLGVWRGGGGGLNLQSAMGGRGVGGGLGVWVTGLFVISKQKHKALRFTHICILDPVLRMHNRNQLSSPIASDPKQC